jgi:hypothetical protein
LTCPWNRRIPQEDGEIPSEEFVRFSGQGFARTSEELRTWGPAVLDPYGEKGMN